MNDPCEIKFKELPLPNDHIASSNPLLPNELQNYEVISRNVDLIIHEEIKLNSIETKQKHINHDNEYVEKTFETNLMFFVYYLGVSLDIVFFFFF